MLEGIEIRIRRDGCIQFSALSAELLEVAAAICPNDPEIKRRLEIMRRAKAPTANKAAQEMTDGPVQTEQGN